MKPSVSVPIVPADESSPMPPRPNRNSIHTDYDPARTDFLSARRVRSTRWSHGSNECSPTRSGWFFPESPRLPRAASAPRKNPWAASHHERERSRSRHHFVRGVDIVLNKDRYPVQRPARSFCDAFLIERFRNLQARQDWFRSRSAAPVRSRRSPRSAPDTSPRSARAVNLPDFIPLCSSPNMISSSSNAGTGNRCVATEALHSMKHRRLLRASPQTPLRPRPSRLSFRNSRR